MPFLLVLSGFAAWLIVVNKQAAPSSKNTVDKATIYDAIDREIVKPLGLDPRAQAILGFQSSRETARWSAWYFQGPQPDGLPPTFSLFNRQVGSGRGDWTGKAKPIKGGSFRIFTDVYQSARDFRQRLTAYSDMAPALAALKRGDGPGYFLALEAMKYSENTGDYAAYADQFSKGVAA